MSLILSRVCLLVSPFHTLVSLHLTLQIGVGMGSDSEWQVYRHYLIQKFTPLHDRKNSVMAADTIELVAAS